MINAVVVSLLLLFSFQDPTDFNRRCPPEGRTKSGAKPTAKKQALYREKAKYEIPAEYDTVSIKDLLAKSKDDADDWYGGVPIAVRAYVQKVFDAGVESCNCYLTGTENLDTRIYLTKGPAYKPHLVAEVSPRLKEILEVSTADLRSLYEGRWVHVSGYLFFDPDHTNICINSGGKPTSKHPRQTAWEIHPVTKIELAK